MIGKAAEKYLGINELGWETVKEMLSGTSPSMGWFFVVLIILQGLCYMHCKENSVKQQEYSGSWVARENCKIMKIYYHIKIQKYSVTKIQKISV